MGYQAGCAGGHGGMDIWATRQAAREATAEWTYGLPGRLPGRPWRGMPLPIVASARQPTLRSCPHLHSHTSSPPPPFPPPLGDKAVHLCIAVCSFGREQAGIALRPCRFAQNAISPRVSPLSCCTTPDRGAHLWAILNHFPEQLRTSPATVATPVACMQHVRIIRVFESVFGVSCPWPICRVNTAVPPPLVFRAAFPPANMRCCPPIPTHM
eukprot:224640-Chlamydomonas_euryale.AAC.1